MSGRQTSWFGAAVILGLGALAALPFRNAPSSPASRAARFSGTVAENIVWQDHTPELQMPSTSSDAGALKPLREVSARIPSSAATSPVPANARITTIPSISSVPNIEEEYGSLLRRYQPAKTEAPQPIPDSARASESKAKPVNTKNLHTKPVQAKRVDATFGEKTNASQPKAASEAPREFVIDAKPLVAVTSTATSSPSNATEATGDLRPLNQSSAAASIPSSETPRTARKDAARSSRGENTRPARSHRIKDGDTLAALAERYLGDASRAQEIYQANRKILNNPELLPIGKRLIIPSGASSPAFAHDELPQDELRRLPPVNAPTSQGSTDPLVPLQ